jgi:phenylacetate-CoA ligase
MLLTNLFNPVQPLIRYDLVDAVTMTDEPCPCGCAHRRITSVDGRIDGAFEYDTGAVVPRAAFEQTVLATPGVANFFIDKTQGGVDVSLVTDGSCDLQLLQKELIDVLRRHGGPEADVVVQEVGSTDRLWSGKSKQFDAKVI